MYTGDEILDKSGTITKRPSVTLKPGFQNYEFCEAFKTLRTNIDFSGEDIKAICITSALPNDGKTTVSYNLARVFAESGRKTLLIDADLRKSVLKIKVCESGDSGQGLTYYLVDQKTYEETVCQTNLQTLDIIFAGHHSPNPSELLSSKRFTALIEQAKKEYSMIIIDTPPIGSVIDAAVVAKVCDGSVLVLKDGVVSYRLAQRCKSQLEAAKAPILGCVLNNVDHSTDRYYNHYYKAYLGEHYGD